MLKELIKSISLATLILSVASCSSSNSMPESARRLLNQGKEAFKAGDYSKALQLLDSVDRTYPQAIEVRREAQKIRPQILEQYTVEQINEVESEIQQIAIVGDSLSKFIEPKNNDLEFYYVAKGTKQTNVNNTPGLHARLTPQYSFYAVATSTGCNDAKTIEVKVGDTCIVSPIVTIDGERNRCNSGKQTITFTEAEIDSIGKFISDNNNCDITLSFKGNGNISLPLNKIQIQQFINLYQLSKVVKKDNFLRIERKRLDEQLHTVRTQLARTAE